ncbi:MAG TPA: hypothetical protein VNV88_02080, partial [Candidatus Solibacter sp.]|nr:hypothetical protein [Candidatus Solibacter sp.]
GIAAQERRPAGEAINRCLLLGAQELPGKLSRYTSHYLDRQHSYNGYAFAVPQLMSSAMT